MKSLFNELLLSAEHTMKFLVILPSDNTCMQQLWTSSLYVNRILSVNKYFKFLCMEFDSKSLERNYNIK